MASTGQAIRNAASSQVPQFSQTAFIFGVVGLLFLVYITLRGDLPKWLGLFGFGSAATPPAMAQGSSNSNVLQFPTLPNLPNLGGH